MGLAKRTGLLMLISAACVIVLAFTTSTIATGSGGRLVGQWIGAGLVILAVSALGAALTRKLSDGDDAAFIKGGIVTAVAVTGVCLLGATV